MLVHEHSTLVRLMSVAVVLTLFFPPPFYLSHLRNVFFKQQCLVVLNDHQEAALFGETTNKTACVSCHVSNAADTSAAVKF